MDEEEDDKKSVEGYWKQFGGYFENISCGILYGKMPPQEKQQVMDMFADGQIQALVSTTVVEVGVNVPNATVILIEDAGMFGMLQLHQLRGRVGRGDAES